MPLFRATRITVILSVIILLFLAMSTISSTTSWQDYSICSCEDSFYFTNETHSSEENLSKRPSDARMKKSSVLGFKSTTLISGSHKINDLITFSLVVVLSVPSRFFGGISIFLQSKSPKAREIANRPKTLPYTIYPPLLLIRSCSSFLLALWSTDKSMALPSLHKMPLASPTLAQ